MHCASLEAIRYSACIIGWEGRSEFHPEGHTHFSDKLINTYSQKMIVVRARIHVLGHSGKLFLLKFTVLLMSGAC